jgi:hypothetical protein
VRQVRGFRGAALAVSLAAVAVVMAACQSLLPASAADRVFLSNDTTTDVAVHVNGGWVGTVGAGASFDVPIGGHGGPPFHIEARSRSGAVLWEMTISPDDYEQVRDGRSSFSSGVAPGCGWIEARYGEPGPDAPAAAEAPVGVQAPGGVCP